ncbi:MAG: hypothetical protein RLN70_10010, partial [Rhodospirillaceae bacterium]
LTSESDLRAHPVLSAARWPGEGHGAHADLLASDERYQMLVLLRGDEVLDAQLYFTFWGDLSRIALDAGYSRGEAVFISESRDGLYIVSPAVNMPEDACA